jgi:argininosuccinate synthase
MEAAGSLYDEEISSFGYSELYDHHDAEGFIKIFSLPFKIKALKNKKKTQVDKLAK